MTQGRVVLVFVAGAILFVLLAWIRAHLPFSMEGYLVVTIPASLAPWGVPGVIVGLLVPRRAVLVEAALGLVTGAALALWQDRSIDYVGVGRDMAIKGGWGILFCGASAWIGSKLPFGLSCANTSPRSRGAD